MLSSIFESKQAQGKLLNLICGILFTHNCVKMLIQVYRIERLDEVGLEPLVV